MTTEEARTDHEDAYDDAAYARETSAADDFAQNARVEPLDGEPPAAPAQFGSRRPPTRPALPAKVPMTASLLSVVPGLGNIYNGLYGRGIAFFLIQFSLLRLAVATQRDEDLALMIPSLIFFWLFNIFDAYRQALLINFGGGDRVGNTHRRSETGGLLFPGLVLVGIGTIGALNRYAAIDVWQVFDHWPALILIAGVVLVVRSVLARSSSQQS